MKVQKLLLGNAAPAPH